jgi:hypothetical protein
MEHDIADINDLVHVLAAAGMKPVLHDEVWQCYGYKKVPRRGQVWYKMFPKTFALEKYIQRELLTMGLIDVLNGIKKSAVTSDTKLLIAIGVIDAFLSTTKGLFSSDAFMEHLFSTYASLLISDQSERHMPAILRAKEVLDDKDVPRFWVGTTKLFIYFMSADDVLLRINHIKDSIDSSSMENKLRISMPGEMYDKYAALLSEKILNV